MLNELAEKGICETDDERILDIPFTEEGVRSFLVEVVNGLWYKDPFCIAFAEAIGIID